MEADACSDSRHAESAQGTDTETAGDSGGLRSCSTRSVGSCSAARWEIAPSDAVYAQHMLF
jgi:hypothetical protein